MFYESAVLGGDGNFSEQLEEIGIKCWLLYCPAGHQALFMVMITVCTSNRVQYTKK